MSTKRLNLSVQYACAPDGLPLRPEIRAWVRAALDVDTPRGKLVAQGIGRGEIPC